MVTRPHTSESGQTTAEFVLVIGLFFAVFLAGIQIAYLMYSASALTGQIQSAVWTVDASSLELAGDKDEFLRKEILKNSSGIASDSLAVSHTSTVVGTESSASSLNTSLDQELGLSELTHKRTTMTIECDVSYEVPFLFKVFDMTSMTNTRHIEHVLVLEETTEVV